MPGSDPNGTAAGAYASWPRIRAPDLDEVERGASGRGDEVAAQVPLDQQRIQFHKVRVLCCAAHAEVRQRDDHAPTRARGQPDGRGRNAALESAVEPPSPPHDVQVGHRPADRVGVRRHISGELYWRRVGRDPQRSTFIYRQRQAALKHGHAPLDAWKARERTRAMDLRDAYAPVEMTQITPGWVCGDFARHAPTVLPGKRWSLRGPQDPAVAQAAPHARALTRREMPPKNLRRGSAAFPARSRSSRPCRRRRYGRRP